MTRCRFYTLWFSNVVQFVASKPSEACLIFILLLSTLLPLRCPTGRGYHYLMLSEIEDDLQICAIRRRDQSQLQHCPRLPSSLDHFKHVKKEVNMTMLQSMAKDRKIESGGRWYPSHCGAWQRVAIIVPYRNRESQLHHFLQHMHPFFQDQLLDYAIFIVEQSEEHEFNRGKLFNIGFVEVLKETDFCCFIFHDVDLLPESPQHIYGCSEQPRHMCSALDTFRYVLPYPELFGGAVAFTKEQFELVNGYSNLYFGWGGEDDDLCDRILYKQLKIRRWEPQISRYTMLFHKKAAPNPERCDLTMQIQTKLTSCLSILYLLILMHTPGKNASAIQIRPSTCTNAMGEQGVCMFVWECIKQDGRQLGTCVDRFLVGACCLLPSEAENFVPGGGLGSTNYTSMAPMEDVHIFKPDSSNVQPSKMSYPSIAVTSAPFSVKTNVSLTVTGVGILDNKLRKTSTAPTTVKPRTKPVVDFSECGVPSPQPKMKIVGGTQASFGDWPWQVSIRRKSFFGFNSAHRCGGAILNENWIITAGHCVDDMLASQIRVRVGEYDFSSTKEKYPFQERGLQLKVVHPRYNFFTYEYDLALLKLDSPVVLQPHVKPICLPPTNDTLEGRNATVTGWGRLSDAGSLPSILQEVQLPIVSNQKCIQMFDAVGRKETIGSIFMCAGYEGGGKDSCQGDSGGPVQVKGNDGKWFLAGIISWGIGCAEVNMPGVCTRVSKFTDWIRATIR